MAGKNTLRLAVALVLGMAMSGAARTAEETTLPAGVKTVWDFDQAFSQKTPLREKVCLNGLWRWQPGQAATGEVPAGHWGYFKVPGAWPGSSGYRGAEAQLVYPHPSWAAQNLAGLKVAWYQREIGLPAAWKGRAIWLDVSWLQSAARVFVDGKPAGDLAFPGGRLNLTALCKPGEKQLLSLIVAAVPQSKTTTTQSHFNVSETTETVVARRGLCGDLYLESMPALSRIADVKAVPSVRKWELGVDTALADLDETKEYRLKAEVLDGGKMVHAFESKPFKAAELVKGRFTFAAPWHPEKLWDTNTPLNQYDLNVSLECQGQAADAFAPVRFGFREFWADGRDFRLNGTRFHLYSVAYQGPLMSAYDASYAGAKEAFTRLKNAGFTMVYSGNFRTPPGTHLGLEDTFRAADDTGMLFSLTLPNFRDEGYGTPGSSIDDIPNALYAQHVEYYVRQAQNHPAIVFYAINHNSGGFAENQDPDLLHTVPGYLANPKTIPSYLKTPGAQKFFPEPGELADFVAALNTPGQRTDSYGRSAWLCERVIHGCDPTRIIYHHGGVYGAVISPNIYLDFIPIEEVANWFHTWSEKGTKPVFISEFAVPSDADYTLFRGYALNKNGEFDPAGLDKNGQRNASHFYGKWTLIEYHISDWGAQFLGDPAYNMSEDEKTNLRWEAEKIWRVGKGKRPWEYPISYTNKDAVMFNYREPMAMYLADMWPAYRAMGLSGLDSERNGENYYVLKKDARQHNPIQTRGEGKEKTSFMALPPQDWEHQQRPGLSPDFVGVSDRSAYFPTSFRREDWEEMPFTGKVWTRVSAPVLAYIAGQAAHLTSKDHDFYPGETFEKQLVVINDSRVPVSADCQWRCALPAPQTGREQVKVETGDNAKVPVTIKLPQDLPPGRYELTLSAKITPGDTQQDTFAFTVLPRPAKPNLARKISLFDPAGQTKALLNVLGVPYTEVAAGARVPADGVLVIGKGALTVDGAAPDVSAVREGLRVVVCEQSFAALEQRLGFRAQEYRLRNLFPRIPGHPALAGLGAGEWWNWRGDSGVALTDLVHSYPNQKYDPLTTRWCGMEVFHPWRGSAYGAVASIIPETPSRGDFLPVLEGGFGLQYAPLMEYREGRGVIIFCQLDVSMRGDVEPAAQTLVKNVLEYAGTWQPGPERKAYYAGDAAGLAHFAKLGLTLAPYTGNALTKDDVLVLGPGIGATLGPQAAALGAWLKAGGQMLAVGLTEDEANSVLPFKVALKKEEYMSTTFPAADGRSLLAGVRPAQVHARDPRVLPLVTGSDDVEALGCGILARAKNVSVVFCQLAPWQYDYKDMHNLKTTYRYSSALLSRVLANMGVRAATPLLSRFAAPAAKDGSDARWKELYVDTPVEGDDPYRYFCW